MKTIIYSLQLSLLLFAAMGCKKDKGFVHDNNAPVVIDKFTPEAGAAGTEVLIYGSNFSTDTTGVTVTVNGVKALITGIISDHILVVIPVKAGTGKVMVSINGKTAEGAKDFQYQASYKVTTLAGNGTAGFADGIGTKALFNFEDRCGLDVDDEGNLYVADSKNYSVRKITPDGTVTTLAGNGEFGYQEGKGDAARFQLPTDVAVDKDGNVFVSDPFSWALRKISPDGTTTLIDWVQAWGLGVDKRNGTLYCVNSTSGKIYQVPPGGSPQEIISGLNNPADVAVDDQGNLFVTESGSSLIKKFTAGTWEPAVIAGDASGTGLVNGVGSAARFEYPWGIAIDAQNNLFIAGNGSKDAPSSNSNQCIRFITANTWNVSTYIGGTTAGFADGTGAAGLFNVPTGVAVDKNNTVYVVDRVNNRIRMITSE
ncbi:IPT/TIG domain-containing protein [Chitinophaga sp. MM2321]|uniref:IPT/TIG domain-containing protein n=1 Tax=Chitinophaga sp. MM2321 TaxID=3137178 RepID=UPI0032D5A5E1